MMLRRRRSEPDDEESKKDQTASSTRASARNQGAEMALVAVDRERVGKPSPNGPVGEDMKTPLPIEDFPAEPVGSPKALGPRNLQPLFNEAQLKKAEELRLSAPLLQGPSPTAVSQSHRRMGMGVWRQGRWEWGRKLTCQRDHQGRVRKS